MSDFPKAKYRVCGDCRNPRSTALMCPQTRMETEWREDEHGNQTRTISGGICARTIENYGRPVAA